MSRFAALLCTRRAPQIAALALISIGSAGCSADMQTRFAQNPSSGSQSSTSQSGQFGWQREATGSVAAAPAAPVERQELPQYARPQQPAQYQSSALPPPIAAPQS